VTPIDPPPFAPDPLVDGKHQPDPRPFKPVTKTTATTPRGTVWRARQVLLNLGKRKRQPSEETGTSTGVQISAADYDVPLLSDSLSETELFHSKVSPLSFVLVVQTTQTSSIVSLQPPKRPDQRHASHTTSSTFGTFSPPAGHSFPMPNSPRAL
jgi:hypothetical protein